MPDYENKAGQFVEKEKDGAELVRWDTKKKYSKAEQETQRQQFEEAAKAGKRICLTDLFITHGL